VTRLVLAEAAGAVTLGAAVGLAGALAAHRFLAPMLGVGEGVAAAVVTLSVTLAGTGVLAAWHPVRRALGVDPREALRAE
jgi:ABC-type antimicrobial peptide transport system permease subunit